MNTIALIRELFYDYGAGKISIDLKADIDQFLTRYTPFERIALKLFSYGFRPTEIEYILAEVPDTQVIIEFLISALNALSSYLEINDSTLYQRVKPTKHGTMRAFLTAYSNDLDRTLFDEEKVTT